MTDCSFVRDHLSAFMDGELASTTTEIIAQHLATCDSCSHELAQFQQMSSLVSGSTLDAGNNANRSPLPPWELLEKRMPPSGTAGTVGSDIETQPAQVPTPTGSRNWTLMFGAVAALAASLLIIAGLSLPKGGDRTAVQQASLASINLQPVLESFQQNSEAALSRLSDQFTVKNIPLAEADADLGRTTYVNTAANENALPGGARLASATLISLPFCKCPPGQCSCEGGCNCVACVCQRPDGSTYLVFEHCKSQGVSFGDLPVKLVLRDGHQIQQVTMNGTQTISFDRSTGTITAVGLRDDAEIETLLASN
ncbi:MAG: zf-HC2 domain-containing protein [Planctomycetales bacterium]|nr:zf-HC2 domain-containing protein [Planctomycetales bacterium]